MAAVTSAVVAVMVNEQQSAFNYGTAANDIRHNGGKEALMPNLFFQKPRQHISEKVNQ